MLLKPKQSRHIYAIQKTPKQQQHEQQEGENNTAITRTTTAAATKFMKNEVFLFTQTKTQENHLLQNMKRGL